MNSVRKRYCLLLLDFLLAGCVAGARTAPAAGKMPGPSTGESPAGKVICYWENSSPSEEQCSPPGCQWRVFYPMTRRDELFLVLPQEPKNVFWDSEFQWVHYRLGEKVYRAPWKFGAQPEEILSVPAGSAAAKNNIVDLWKDRHSGAWRMETLEYTENQPVAGAWEYAPATREWKVLEKIPTECECDGCPCTDVLKHLVHKADSVVLTDLLESMRVEHHLQRLEPGGNWGEGPRDFPSQSLADRWIRVTVQWGDTVHAIAPLLYLNPGRGEEKVIYGKDAPCYEQIAFGEEGGFLLVVAEHSGGCARVVDMRTGAVVRSLPPNSSRAVWVDPPRR